MSAVAGVDWSVPTRTLTGDPATDAGAATLVWGHTGRTQTSMNGYVTGSNAGKTSIAASATVSIQPAVNHVLDLVVALDSAQLSYLLNDGSNSIGATSGAIGVTTFCGLVNAVFLQVKNNDGASAHNYMYAGVTKSYA